jgi:hypothetical protein
VGDKGLDQFTAGTTQGFGPAEFGGGEGGKMNARFKGMFASDTGEKSGVADIALIKGDGRIDGLAMPAGEIIEDDNLLTTGAQMLDSHTADISRASLSPGSPCHPPIFIYNSRSFSCR